MIVLIGGIASDGTKEGLHAGRAVPATSQVRLCVHLHFTSSRVSAVLSNIPPIDRFRIRHLSILYVHRFCTETIHVRQLPAGVSLTVLTDERTQDRDDEDRGLLF